MLRVAEYLICAAILGLLGAPTAEAGGLNCKIERVVRKNGEIKRGITYPSFTIDKYEHKTYSIPISGTDFTLLVETDSTYPGIIKEFPDLVGYTGKVERTLNQLMIADSNGNLDNFVFVTNNPGYYYARNLALTYQFKTQDGFQWMFATCTID